jgi:hypothetical protein
MRAIAERTNRVAWLRETNLFRYIHLRKHQVFLSHVCDLKLFDNFHNYEFF